MLDEDDVKPAAQKTALRPSRRSADNEKKTLNIKTGELSYITDAHQARAVRPSRRNKDSKKKQTMTRERASTNDSTIVGEGQKRTAIHPPDDYAAQEKFALRTD
jgi:hypothetical protein